MKTVAVIINARLASSRCPQKLIKPFCDTTLLDIALSKLAEIKVDEKYLAAGDKEIIDLYSKYSNRVGLLRRDADAVAPGEHPHSVSFRHYTVPNTSHVFIMNPCLPFVKKKTYQSAIDHFKSDDSIRTLTSVIEFKDIFFDESNQIITLPNIHHLL